ncbi:hypothetical protein PpBr36_04079 [Pyricularia pennisetigena]|uniref:hypothetical protein n=1 Tax=Pyricularia pennisetigena TaxID=1578925 RepID=UPI001151C82E|nr:hypothetical protein PpBr36_04079 [Pyricularia pennisetigena]TLS26552.1 hypothetical protein PpBr36_04079 [Pyricularia pennisetigena]
MASETPETITVTKIVQPNINPSNAPEPPQLISPASSPVPSFFSSPTPTTFATSVRATSSSDPTALPSDTDQETPANGPPTGAIVGIVVVLVIAAVVVVVFLGRKCRRLERAARAEGFDPNPRRAPGTGSQGRAPWEPSYNAAVEQVTRDRPTLNGSAYERRL